MNPLEIIPAEYHLATLVLTGVLGFLVILFLSQSLSAPKPSGGKKKGKSAKKPAQKSTAKTPKKSAVKNGSMGTVNTPEGRRSSRIASRKE